jgi:hypothetical protein
MKITIALFNKLQKLFALIIRLENATIEGISFKKVAPSRVGLLD